MKENFRFDINDIKYKHTDNSNFIQIEGWCFHTNKESFEYEVLVNGKSAFFECIPVQRMDVYNRYQNEMTTNMVGFYIRVEILDSLNTFELRVKSASDVQSLVIEDASKISKIEDTNSIEYNIDVYQADASKGMATCIGWSYSVDYKNVDVKIVDENNQEVEMSIRGVPRNDLVKMKRVDESQKGCGFQISFLYQPSKKYYLYLETDTEFLKVDCDIKKISKLSLLKAYVLNINGKNLKKAITYLKRNGVKSFLNRLKYGVNTNGDRYCDWFMAHRIKEDELVVQRNTKFKFAPKISIIVATFNTKESYLKEMIDTVVNQSYTNWQLCVADGSKDDSVLDYIKTHYHDNRIVCRKLDKNYGISGNMNAALELADGDYVALYDHDDMLELDCLFEVVSALQEFQYDIVYTDEDKFDDNAKEYMDPNFKPDYSVDLFRSHNYITHFFCVNKKIIDQVGGMRSEYDGSQDYDFMFRCIEKANGIYHVAKILYHWRMHPLSTAQNPESKMYCYEAGKKAIEAHYMRTGVDAKVEMMPKPYFGLYHTKYSTKENPLVSILIPNMNHKSVLKTCIDSLYTVNEYKNFEIIIIENNSNEQEIFDYYEELQKTHDNIRVVTWKEGFNYSAINNFGAQYANGEYLLLLNNDTEMITKDALTEMVGCCMRPEVGVVGAKLLYADNTIQHAGVVIGFSGYAGHVFNGLSDKEYGYMMRLLINCNYSSVTGACLMVKKEIFDEVGGLDEDFRVACNDVDFCLKVREKGYLVVYNAFSKWYHYESKSRGYDDNNKEKMWRFNEEVEHFQQKWAKILNEGDPYYNKNFRIENGPFKL